MKQFTSDLKIGFLALAVTLAVASIMILFWYQDYSVSRQFLGEAQKISATLPILAVTEGQVASWTKEIRKNETTRGELDAHLVEQINKIRLGEYTADQLKEHLGSCKRFCGSLIGKIFETNMREVAKLPHSIIFFDNDKDKVALKYQRVLVDFAKTHRNQKIYVLGRAGYIGRVGYDKELSSRRVKQVEATLRKSGIAEEQIKSSWFGYEAPQLTREIADSYKIDPKEYNQDLYSLNQSVLLFTSSPGEYFPGVIPTMEKELGNRTSGVKSETKVSKSPKKANL